MVLYQAWSSSTCTTATSSKHKREGSFYIFLPLGPNLYQSPGQPALSLGEVVQKENVVLLLLYVMACGCTIVVLGKAQGAEGKAHSGPTIQEGVTTTS